MEEKNIKNSTEAFEKALIQSNTTHYCLHLYISGTTLKSIRAIEISNVSVKTIFPNDTPWRLSIFINNRNWLSKHRFLPHPP